MQIFLSELLCGEFDPWKESYNFYSRFNFGTKNLCGVSEPHCCKYTHTKKDDGKAKYIEKSQPLPQHMWIRRVNKGCDIKLLYFVFMQMKQKINRSLLIFITAVNSEYFSKKQFFRFYLHNKSLPCNNLDHSSMFKYHITFIS